MVHRMYGNTAYWLSGYLTALKRLDLLLMLSLQHDDASAA